MPLNTPSPIDQAWQTRIPQGWIQFPDGSIGPPNSVGSDWNAPYRTQSGINPPSPSALGRPNVGPGMGFPAAGIGPLGAGPPPQPPPPPPPDPGGFSLGMNAPEGTTTLNTPGNADPSATFQQGQSMGPDVTGGGDWPPGLSTKTIIDIARRIGTGNPLLRTLAQIMQSTPANTGEAPRQTLGRSPSGPVPGPLAAPPPYEPGSGVMPPTAQPATNVGAPAPAIPPLRPLTPLPPPRPKSRIDPATVDLGTNPRFKTIQYKVPSGRGPLSSNPIYTVLNLGG